MTTLADLRDALQAQALDVPAAEDVLERARTRRTTSYRGLLAAAAVVALAAGVLVVVLRGGSSAPPAEHDWRTFRTAGFSVRYPPTWHAATYEEVSTMTASIVFLSDQPMSNPCTTTANNSICRGGAVRHLLPGGVSVYWFTFSHQQAVIAPDLPPMISTDPACTSIGGVTSISKRFQNGTLGSFEMYACVAAGPKSKQVALVLESLRSMRQ